MAPTPESLRGKTHESTIEGAKRIEKLIEETLRELGDATLPSGPTQDSVRREALGGFRDFERSWERFRQSTSAGARPANLMFDSARMKRLMEAGGFPKLLSQTDFTYVDINTVKQQAAAIKAMEAGRNDRISNRSLELERSGMPKTEATAKATTEWEAQIKRMKENLPVVLDSSGPGLEGVPTIDHHGVFGKKPNGKTQKANTLMQVVNLSEEALRATGVKDLRRPATDQQIEKAIAWIKETKGIDVTRLSWESLGDGTEAAWGLMNIRRLMKEPTTRAKARRLGHFVDGASFGNRYDRKHPEVSLGAALFGEYNRILKKYVSPHLKPSQIITIDSIGQLPPLEADAAAREAVSAVDRLFSASPEVVQNEAKRFWDEVDQVKRVLPKAILHSHVDPKTGRKLAEAYNLETLSEFGLFATWVAAPDLQRGVPQAEKLPLQMTASPGSSPAQSMSFLAIPHGMRLALREGLMVLKDRIVSAEKAKREAIGDQRTPDWIIKPNVMLPHPMGGGTFLSPKEIFDIAADPAYGLFEPVAESRPLPAGLFEKPLPDLRPVDQVVNDYSKDPKKLFELTTLAKVEGPMGQMARDFLSLMGPAQKTAPTFEDLSRMEMGKREEIYLDAKKNFDESFLNFLRTLDRYPKQAAFDLHGRPFFQVRYAGRNEIPYEKAEKIPTDRVAEIDILVPDPLAKLTALINLRLKGTPGADQGRFENTAGDGVTVNFRVGTEWPDYRIAHVPAERRPDVTSWLAQKGLQLDSLSFRQQDELLDFLARDKKWASGELEKLIGRPEITRVKSRLFGDGVESLPSNPRNKPASGQ